MYTYFAGSIGVEKDCSFLQEQLKYRLLSYHYRVRSIDAFYYGPGRSLYEKIILDSGAFSAWSKGVSINIKEYADYCLANLHEIDYMINLDVIPARPGIKNIPQAEIERSARVGYENYYYLLDRGIPKEKLWHVFHQNEDFKWLAKMAGEMDFICLSPANDRTTQEKIWWLYKCMDYVTDWQGIPTVGFHGLAVTSLTLMNIIPWKSVDSVRGDSMLFIKEGGRIRTDTIENVYLSAIGDVEKPKPGQYHKQLHDIELWVVDDSGVGQWAPATKVMRHETIKPMQKVTTKRGRAASLTPDHGLFIKKDIGAHVCLPTDNLNVGDKAIGVNYTEEYGTRTEITVQTNRLAYRSKTTDKSTTCRRLLPYRVKLDEDLMSYFGLWIADGSMCQGSVSISCGDYEVLALEQRIASRFNTNVYSVGDHVVDNAIHSTLLFDIINELGFSGTSATKEIPWWIHETPENLQAAFLRGYFSGDGSIDEKTGYITADTINRKLLYSLLFMLTRIGIQPTITDAYDKEPTISEWGGIAQPSHTLRILDGTSFIKFASTIKFIQTKRNITLQKRIDSFSEIRGIREEYNESEIYLPITKKTKDQACRWVYDLEVPQGQKFVANGLLVHNSSTWASTAGRGIVTVPVKRNGEWDFSQEPYRLSMSSVVKTNHFLQESEGHRTHILEYLEYIGYVLGRSEHIEVDNEYQLQENERLCPPKYIINLNLPQASAGKKWIEIVHERGVCNDWKIRQYMNAYFINKFTETIPCPNPFKQEVLSTII